MIALDSGQNCGFRRGKTTGGSFFTVICEGLATGFLNSPFGLSRSSVRSRIARSRLRHTSLVNLASSLASDSGSQRMTTICSHGSESINGNQGVLSATPAVHDAHPFRSSAVVWNNPKGRAALPKSAFTALAGSSLSTRTYRAGDQTVGLGNIRYLAGI